MTCDAAQNRLLTLADPGRPPDPLRLHVEGCGRCRLFAAKLGTLDKLLRQLPVPPADPQALAATLDKVTADAPIITRVPTVPRRDSTVDLPRLLLKEGRWGYTVGVAASVGLAVVGWWVLAGRVPDAKPQLAAAPRHELLGHGVRHLAKLSASDKPDDQLREWAALATDLTREARTLYRVADPTEFDALEGMFTKAVTKGVVGQANKVAGLPAARRTAALSDATAKLAEAEKAVTALVPVAPPATKPALERMRDAVTQARTALQRGA
jgi:hypothetical protein